MPEQQMFHTKDGKTIVYDVGTGQVKIQALEPKPENAIPPKLAALLKQLILPQPTIVDLVFIPGGQQEIKDEKEEDILGPLDYYILVPIETEKLIYKAVVPITAWVSEYKNGHKPDYTGYNKHRILPEQFGWLNQHKDCQVVAWYAHKCPIFASLGCQTHAKSIQPCIPQDDPENS